MDEQTYAPAPLDMMAKGITIGVAFMLLLIGWIDEVSFMLMAMIAAGLLGSTYLFSVRAYRISADYVTVVHPFWERAWALAELTDISTPTMGLRTIRLFGSGGMFGYLGWFRNRELGNYLAFVTDRIDMVGLHFSERTVVISPADPLTFIDDLKMYSKL